MRETLSMSRTSEEAKRAAPIQELHEVFKRLTIFCVEMPPSAAEFFKELHLLLTTALTSATFSLDVRGKVFARAMSSPSLAPYAHVSYLGRGS